jgi:hypothetical protein
VSRHIVLRARLETSLAILTAFLFVLSVFSRDWIEVIFGVDPDGHSGSVEWTLVGACAVVALTSGLLARRDWKRVAVAAEP